MEERFRIVSKFTFELTCAYFLDFFLCKQCNELLPLKVTYDGIHIYFCILTLKLVITEF